MRRFWSFSESKLHRIGGNMLSKLGNKVRSGVTQRRTGVTVLAGSLAVLAVWMIAGQVPVGASNTLGTIKGLGSAGFISKFLDNYTIVSSGIFENQGNVGIGTTNPQAKLDVLGSIRIDGAGNGLTFADGSSVYNRDSLIGPQGPQGLQGAPGINGTNGTNGAPGPPGYLHHLRQGCDVQRGLQQPYCGHLRFEHW
jgi:hypothetical protein